MCTISKSSNLPEDSKKDPQPQNIKRSKLSPTSRLFDMLSQEQNMTSELSDSSHETGPLIYTETEPCADTKLHIVNPTNYNSSNPRSIKNMSYLQTADAKESNGNSLQSAQKQVRQKSMRSLSVEKRLTELKDEIPEEISRK